MPRRQKPMRARNAKRRTSEFARCYGSRARVAWIKHLPSVVSLGRPCVNAHVRNGGAGRKADARYIVPLTDAEHRELHAIGRASFERKYGVELDRWACLIDARWQRHQLEEAA